ncbi:hypoxanthine phosphoribosyltransferase [Puniceicoccus vermicola]|uniref:Hypoxanthine phosphoribosyltransferase n=1 Tax=Puniceicoccus vermicola TaxID=388746 RepID=A0A7X1B222_9BACT|nr:hypoxanthine phosphoribosyltransferase [Puniceicoccus vermicola]MBC2604184.1 hypoxanthine phosphoribosyltransferase [Puniceicoccus vermicola]
MEFDLQKDLKSVLFSAEEIQARVKQLAQEVEETCAGDEVTVISIINGAMIFTADLIRRIRLPLRLDCIRASSYGDETRPTHAPKLLDSVRLDVEGRHVLLVDDILDTGNTLKTVRDEMLERNPASVRTCVLLDKKARRAVEFEADLVGFVIPDEFVVGYGLDFAERYRHLPCIGILKEENQSV